MRQNLRQRRMLRKLTTPMETPKPSFFRYLITGGKSGKWWIAYWIMMALFWAFARPWYLAAIVNAVTLAVFVYGTWRNYNGKQA